MLREFKKIISAHYEILNIIQIPLQPPLIFKEIICQIINKIL